MSEKRAGAGGGPDAGADGKALDENEQAGTSSLSSSGDDESSGGEDDASTEVEGDDSHLHEDQKSPTL